MRDMAVHWLIAGGDSPKGDIFFFVFLKEPENNSQGKWSLPPLIL
jgi:hypothetical protein